MLYNQPSDFRFVDSIALSTVSAIEVLQICDRRARRDCQKVTRFCGQAHRVLTSPEARKTYRTIAALAQIACMVSIACGMSAREWCDNLVADNLAKSAQLEVTPAAVEPELQPATDKACTSTDDRLSAESLQKLAAVQLRGLCGMRGVQWRNAHGKSKHLSKKEMIAALAG